MPEANLESAVNRLPSGAELLAAALCDAGVEVLFGYPGGANLEIFDALATRGLRCVRTEHEQGAVHAAEGYARATGKVGVCLATSGPGATNLVTGIADANSDSVPIVALTGNVATHLLGKNAFQEVDIVGIVKPITKQAVLVRDAAEIPAIISTAFAVAAGPRPGPVLIDIPKDVQQQRVKLDKQVAGLGGVQATHRDDASLERGMTDSELRACLTLLKRARRPVIYAGGGIISAEVGRLLVRLSEQLRAPVTTTIMGLGSIRPDHSLSFGVLGMHGAQYANIAVNEADVVLALGVRFDDRVTGDPQGFIRNGKIIHIDVDPEELNKNKPVELPIQADLRIALTQLIDRVEACDSNSWLNYLQELKSVHPLEPPAAEGLTGPGTIKLLSELTAGEALVTTGVGQHQMWAMQHYAANQPRSFISSSGFGTMGFGLPAAIGAKVGCPDRLVINIDGDGSLNMSIHELATCWRYRLGVKTIVINNQWLGMVRQWQDLIYEGRRVESDLSDPRTRSIGDGGPGCYPDFVRIAEGYCVRAERVWQPAQLHDALLRLLEDPREPGLLDVMVEREQNVYPMIPAGKTYKDVLLSDEDLPGLTVGDT